MKKILWCTALFVCVGLLLLGAGCQLFSPRASARSAIAFDLQGFLDREVAQGRQTIVVPPGRYRVQPQHAQHLVLKGLHDIRIMADDVEMICTETTRALTITNCTNVTLRGLTIDYDPLPFTQGRIIKLSADKKIHDIELFAGYPDGTTIVATKYEIFRPDTRTLRCHDYGYTAEKIDAQHIRIVKGHSHADDLEQEGDLIVIASSNAPHGQAGHAIETGHSRKVRLEKITLYASNAFGFLEHDCDGTTYEQCRIDRRPAAEDPVLRASPRLRSLNADAFHSTQAVKGPAYLECSARFMGDDCINIHGTYHMIMAAHGRELRVLANRHLNIQPGDPVELVQYDGQRLPDAQAVAIAPAGAIRDEERAFLHKQRMHEEFRTNAHGALSKAFIITLDREVAMATGGVICALNRIGSGFMIKGCDFGFNRSRGILIKASQGAVIGNRMEGCWMSAILVSPEYWWLESGCSRAVQISGNRIIACQGVPIRVEAPSATGAPAPAGAHEDITIMSNTIKDCPTPGILVTSTKGLRIADNKLQLIAATNAAPQRLRKARISTAQPVIEINCEP